MSDQARVADRTENAWQRLSPWALVFLFLNGLQQFIRQNLAAFAGAGAGFAFVDRLGMRELLLGAAAILLVALAISIVYHRRFRFRLEPDALRVRRGIFEHRELRVRFERVQNVSTSQPFYLRPFGLVRFALETPGAAQKEVELPGISRALAEHMRSRIAAYLPDQVSAESEPAEIAAASEGAVELLRIGPGALFVHGLASNQVWVALGAAAGVLGTMERRITGWLAESEGLIAYFKQLEGTAGLAVAIAIPVALLAVLLVVSGLMSLVRFYGFRLSCDADRFRARYGLLDAREKTLKSAKLQGLVLVQTAIGRLLGRWYLVGRQTGAASQEAHAGRDRFLVPGLDAGTALPAARGLEFGIGDWPEWRPIAVQFRRVFWQRSTAVLMGAAAVLHFAAAAPAWLVGLVVLANLVLLGLIWIRWRWWAWCPAGELLLIRRGLVGQRIAAFEQTRVQHVQVSQNIIQRRCGLATLTLRLPHGDESIPYIGLETATELANRILYRVETARNHEV